MGSKEKWAVVGRVGAFIGGLSLMAVIFFIDIRTTIWQDLVVLSGLAGSLVTFLLTFLVVNRVVGRVTERRWEPVTRVALTDLLHGLADEARSEVTRGIVVPRALPVPRLPSNTEESKAQLVDLLHQIMAERRRLTDRLGVWSEFLASSGSNDGIMKQVANTSLQLDEVRDAVLQAEEYQSEEALAQLRIEVTRCNEYLAALATEIENRLQQHRADS